MRHDSRLYATSRSHEYLCSRVCAYCVRARALDRVICDVSGPIGCHLSSRCRRVPPFTPAISFSLSLSHPLPLPPFIHLSPSRSSSVSVSVTTPLMPPANAIRARDPRYSPPSLSRPSSRNVPSRFNLRDHLCLPLTPAPISLSALSLAGIFSLLPHPPSLVSSSSLYQLPSSTLSHFISLFSAAMPMA